MESNNTTGTANTSKPEGEPTVNQPKGAEEKRDYYQVLEIPRNAEEKDIKKAFRKLAMKDHPVLSCSSPEMCHRTRIWIIKKKPKSVSRRLPKPMKSLAI
jgi:hypothetical protein